MTTQLQDRLREHEPADLRADVASLVDVWAATLLDVPLRELPEHPETDVILHQLTAAELLRAEVERYSRLLERQAWQAGLSQPAIATARGVTPQAVSSRIKAG
jgi:hypothetical protein